MDSSVLDLHAPQQHFHSHPGERLASAPGKERLPVTLSNRVHLLKN